MELIINRNLVNKGTLIGPCLPIYGYGIIFILLIFSKSKLKKYASNFLITFLIISIICTLLEFCTSIYLEKMYGMKWWDYSSYWLNIDGRISFISSFIMGITGCFGLYIYAPKINKIINNINQKFVISLCSVLLLLFTIDNCYCYKKTNQGSGITENVSINYNFFTKQLDINKRI